MHKAMYVLFAVLTAWFFAPGANAMDLSLADAVEKIVSQSHDLRRADANVKSATAQLDAANANRWFQVNGTVSYMNLINVEQPFSSYNASVPTSVKQIAAMIPGMPAIPDKFNVPDNIFSASVDITQPIYTFGKIGNAVRAVRSAIEMSKSAREMTLRAVRYSAADMYWTAKMTDEIVKIAERDLNNAKSARTKLSSAGRASRNNLVKIESDIASKEINLSDAQFNRDTAHRMLKILAGIDVDTQLTLTDNFPDTFGDLNVSADLKTTPEWDIYNRQIKMYEDSARSKRAGGAPTLAAIGSYSYSTLDTSSRHLFDHAGNQSAYWGLALSVPIFTGGVNRANATVDAMNAESARQDLAQAKKITGEKYKTAVKQYDHLRGNLKQLENARDLASRAYGYSADRFASGQTSAIELSEAASGLLQLDMALINMKYNILMSVENIKKLGE